MRRLYTLLILLLLPPALLLLLWRGRREHSHRGRLAERFGCGSRLQRDSLWVHAASVGEVQAAVPLVRALQARFPQYALVVTTMTATGSARARALFGDGVDLRYLPFDLPGAMRRLFARLRPQALLIVETELWPNLLWSARQREVPVILCSARVSERSSRRYRLLGGLIGDALSQGVLVAAQSAADATRYVALGAPHENTVVVGNLKFDLELPADTAASGAAWRARLGAERPVWVAGSTHAGEEAAVLTVHEQLCGERPDALLLLVPRHPQRFAEVAALLRERQAAFVTRSSGSPVTAMTRVLLVDTLGELPLCYAAADLAFVGGSLVPIGGHNLLEPAALGRPVLTGPHTANAPDIAALLLAQGAAFSVATTEELLLRVRELLRDAGLRERMGSQGLAAVSQNRGVLQRLLALLERAISRAR